MFSLKYIYFFRPLLGIDIHIFCFFYIFHRKLNPEGVCLLRNEHQCWHMVGDPRLTAYSGSRKSRELADWIIRGHIEYVEINSV